MNSRVQGIETGDLAQILQFLTGEKDLPARFGMPEEAFLPLFFSLRFGGSWSYRREGLCTISLLKRTSVYDETTEEGYSREEIYLFVNPVLQDMQGRVFRLEKCGEEVTRLCVERPYRVTIGAERIIVATVYPQKREIAVTELVEKTLEFEGSSAYSIAHEFEHLQKKGISGTSLYAFRYR